MTFCLSFVPCHRIPTVWPNQQERQSPGRIPGALLREERSGIRALPALIEIDGLFVDFGEGLVVGIETCLLTNLLFHVHHDFGVI